MSAFDAFSNDGEDVRPSSNRPFEDETFVDYDPHLPSRRFDSYASFATADDYAAEDAPQGGGFPIEEEVTEDDVSHDVDGVHPAPEMYGFGGSSVVDDPNPNFSGESYSVPIANGNGKPYDISDDTDGIFSSDGPVLPPPTEMQAEEGFALREWRR